MALIFGEIIYKSIDISIGMVFLFSVILFGMTVFFVFAFKKFKFLIKYFILFLVIEISIMMGFFLYKNAVVHINEIERKYENNQEYEIYGKIKSLERNTDSQITFAYLEDTKIRTSIEESSIKGRIQINFSAYSNLLKPGRYIRVIGKYSKLEQARNEGNFNRQGYYNTMGIYAIFYSDPEDILYVTKQYNVLTQGLFNIRNSMIKKMYEITNKKYASIISGIILGYRSEIDNTTKELYQIAGISHLLSISGLHISVIGMCVYRIFRKKFRFAFSGIFAIIIVLMFGLMTGNGISTRRAIIMFILGILARITGRTYDILTALSIAAILILVEIPMAYESATMQLSFGALIGIVMAIDYLIPFLRVKFKIIHTLIISECINLITKPVVAGNYYQIPMFSTFVNILVIPLLNIVLCGGIISLIISYISIRAARYIILIPVGVLKLYEYICSFYTKIPFSTIITGKLHSSNTILFYVIFATSLFLIRLVLNKEYTKDNEIEEYWYFRYTKKGCILFIYIILNLLILCGYERYTCIKMLDVGQGDSIYIGTNKGFNLLIDAGSSSNSKVGEYVILPFLKANKVKQIDYLIMTHSDDDHINGMLTLLKYRYQNRPYVKCLVLPDINETMRDEAYIELENIALENRIQVLYMSSGMRITADDFMLSCIYPSKEVMIMDKNELSLNCIVNLAGVQMMFTGDLGRVGEKYLIQTGRLQPCDILKVAHHGSDGSSVFEYIQAIKPAHSFISCSETNRYGHPGVNTIKRLEKEKSNIYITKDSGQISLYIRENGSYMIESFID